MTAKYYTSECFGGCGKSIAVEWVNDVNAKQIVWFCDACLAKQGENA